MIGSIICSSKATVPSGNRRNVSAQHLKRSAYRIATRNATKLLRRLSPQLRQQDKAFSQLRERFYRQFWQDSAQRIGARIELLQPGWWQVERDGNKTYVHGERVMLDSAVMLELAGDKGLVYRLLAEAGYPVPASQRFNSDLMAQAESFLRDSNGAVVVKPVNGWAGQGVTVNIRNAEELKAAVRYAQRFEDDLLVEQHITGDSYRLLFLGGRLIDAVRRDPPQVTGDGKQTVRQLIAAENRLRLTGDAITSLNPLNVDAECKKTLEAQNLGFGTVPAAGKSIALKSVVNQNNRMENHVVREQVHPEIDAMGSAICRQFGLELAGLDLLCSDISKPLAETGGVINEINTTPGLHHHCLIADIEQMAPVGPKVLDYVLHHHPITASQGVEI